MDNGKNRLKQDIKKKITTTMIGALSSFEKRFGKLWGMDVENEEDLTPQQQKFLSIWLEVREEILDRGNAQIGAAQANLDGYNIESVKYHYKFYPRRDNERDDF